MVDLIILIIIFGVALWFTESFIMSLIMAAVFGAMLFDIDIKETKLKVEAQLEQSITDEEKDRLKAEFAEARDEFKAANEQTKREFRERYEDEPGVPLVPEEPSPDALPTEAPAPVEIVITESMPELAMEYISDQIRNVESVTHKGAEVCRSTGQCFVPRLRKHEDGTVYACETDGLQCYVLK